MYQAYSFLYILALVFLFPFEYLRRPSDLRKRWLKERFGFFHSSRITHYSSRIWIHAVSVGEVIAAVPLIKKIKGSNPSSEIVVSTVTDTGQKVANERLGDTARIIYVPFDLPFAIKNVIRRINPSVFIIMETELWPNIIRILSGMGVPVLLMNGRISERSFNGYKKLRFFIKDVLNNMRLICVQNELYAGRIKALGADPEKVRAIGNFKFDTRPSSTVPEWTKILNGEGSRVKGQGFTIIAGSTHRTEEDLIIDAYIKLRADFPQLNLIVAPRHPERFREVEELIKKKGIKYLKRSDVTGHGSQVTGVVVLLDVIGELSSVYSACDVAIMGGSFIEHGGQNPLEPAYWEKAIVCGPHMENFPFIDEFYKSGGAIKTDADNLSQILKDILDSPQKIAAMGAVAKDLYNKNSGAVQRAIKEIERYL